VPRPQAPAVIELSPCWKKQEQKEDQRMLNKIGLV
jgi:hypothetical protein